MTKSSISNAILFASSLEKTNQPKEMNIFIKQESNLSNTAEAVLSDW